MADKKTKKQKQVEKKIQTDRLSYKHRDKEVDRKVCQKDYILIQSKYVNTNCKILHLNEVIVGVPVSKDQQ